MRSITYSLPTANVTAKRALVWSQTTKALMSVIQYLYQITGNAKRAILAIVNRNGVDMSEAEEISQEALKAYIPEPEAEEASDGSN